jgi:hypothetical protein
MRLLNEEQQLVEAEAFEDGGDSFVGFSAISDFTRNKNDHEK